MKRRIGGNPNGNPQNLERWQKAHPELVKENARKAALAAGEARRRRKTMREEFEVALSVKGVQKSIIVAMIQAAQEGSVSAAQFIRDTIGEKPVEKMEQTIDVTEEVRRDAILIELERLSDSDSF